MSIYTRDTIEGHLCALLLRWTEQQGLHSYSADELQYDLVRERERMWREHEDTDKIDAQIEWLRAYSELWELSV